MSDNQPTEDAQPNEGGRPSKLDDYRDEIIDLLGIGCTFKEACAEAGVTYRAFRYWMERGEAGEEPFATFYEDVDRAVTRSTVQWRKLLHNSKQKIYERQLALNYLKYKQRDKPRQVELSIEPSRHAAPMPLVGIREFITSKEYLGRTQFWPKVIDGLEEMTAPGIQGFVIEQGQGGGKSYQSAVLLLYLLYRTAYSEVILGIDPRDEFDLDAGSEIAFANVSLTATNAKEVVFEYAQTFVRESPWFQKHLPYNPKVKRQLQFDRNYCLFPGSSQISSVVGRNILGAIIDEGNLWQDSSSSATNGGEDYVSKMFAELQSRVLSRFGSSGYLGIVSTRRTVNDFTARKRAEIQADPDTAKRYYMPPKRTSWSLWSDERSDKQLWRRFDKDTLQFVDAVGDAKPWSHVSAHSQVGELWVPEDLWISFGSQPEEALRDLASIPADSQCPFFRKRRAIVPDWEMVNPILPTTKPTDWMRPGIDFDELVSDDFYGDPMGRYFWHIDLSKNRDATGITLCFKSGVDKRLLNESDRKAEKAVLIDVPLTIQIKAPPGGEIVFEDIRRILYWLKDKRGVRFAMGSFDGWQSIDSQQQLKRHGFRVEEFSLDRTMVGYSTLKEAIYEGRVFFPPAHGQTPATTDDELRAMAKAGDPCAVLQVELMQLELVNGKKVDHPESGSKDVADATAGAVTQCQRRWSAPSEELR